MATYQHETNKSTILKLTNLGIDEQGKIGSVETNKRETEEMLTSAVQEKSILMRSEPNPSEQILKESPVNPQLTQIR